MRTAALAIAIMPMLAGLSPAAAQLACITIGPQMVCNNGLNVQRLGNVFIDNQGNSWLRYGNMTFGSNGVTYHQSGSQFVGTNARYCQRYENLMFCN